MKMMMTMMILPYFISYETLMTLIASLHSDGKKTRQATASSNSCEKKKIHLEWMRNNLRAFYPMFSPNTKKVKLEKRPHGYKVNFISKLWHPPVAL